MNSTLKSLCSSLYYRKSKETTEILSIRSEESINLGYESDPDSIRRYIEKSFSDKWRNVCYYKWKVSYYARNGDIAVASAAQNGLLQSLTKIAADQDSWILQPLYIVVKDLVDLAFQADKREKTTTHVQNAARSINGVLNMAKNDTLNQDPRSGKLMGVYFFVSQLFKCYFHINNRALIDPIMKSITGTSQSLPPFDQYPKSDRCSFLYYQGLLTFLDQRYEASFIHLDSAYGICYAKSKKNQFLLLLYLIPVQLLVRQLLPPERIWSEFPSLKYLYKDLVDAIKTGNVYAYEVALEKRKVFFMKRRLYLIMNLLKNFVRLVLFQKVFIIIGKPHRINLSVFVNAFAISGLKATQSQIECFISNLIYLKYIRGYMSHDFSKLLLSSTNPFPTFVKIPSIAPK